MCDWNGIFAAAGETLLAVYVNQRQTDRFLVGKVLRHDADALVLALYDAEGKRDGTGLCPYENILRVEWSSQYLNGITSEALAPWDAKDGGAWTAFWQDAQEKQRLVSVTKTDGHKVCGFCDAYDAEKVHLQRICLTGCAGRACTLRRVGMTWVCYDSDDERQLAAKAKEAAEL